MQKDASLTIRIVEGETSEIRIFVLDGPLTLCNLFVFQDVLRSCEVPRLAIFDLSRVPYMDSAALGAIANYYVHCRRIDANLILAGVNSRPLELLELTKLDKVIPMAASVEEVQASYPSVDSMDRSPKHLL